MSDDGSESGMDDGAAAAPSDAGTASTAHQRSSVDSSITSVTADFSMQNVLLQVGTECFRDASHPLRMCSRLSSSLSAALLLASACVPNGAIA